MLKVVLVIGGWEFLPETEKFSILEKCVLSCKMLNLSHFEQYNQCLNFSVYIFYLSLLGADNERQGTKEKLGDVLFGCGSQQWSSGQILS